MAKRKKWRPFSEAREFAWELGLEGKADWSRYCKSGKKPPDIPVDPKGVYSTRGVWTSWGDFLGTGNIRPKDMKFASWSEAREFARGLGLTGESGWRAHWAKTGDRPPDIPATPDRVYRGKGWNGWGDFLGTDNLHPGDIEFAPWSEARDIAQGLGLKNLGDWKRYCSSGKKPVRIPASPQHVYSKTGEWTSWGDFLGTGNIRPQDRNLAPWPEARDIARGLGLKSQADWSRLCKDGKKPHRLPTYPEDRYKRTGEWTNWSDFLGTYYVHPRNIEFVPWPEAREYARGLGLEGKEDWSKFCADGEKPQNIPRNPAHWYKKTGEWTSWGDFLGTGNIQNQDKTFAPWPEARENARKLELKRQAEWVELCKSGKKPPNLPVNPDLIYGKTGEWTSWPDFLGYTPNKWSRTTLLEFIKSLRGTTLETFTETELLMLITHNGALPAFTRAFGRRGPLEVIQDLKENEGRDIEAAINEAGEAPDEEVVAEDESGDPEIAEDVQEVLEHDAQRPPESLPSILAEGGLHDVDVLNEKISGGLDEELAEFYVTNRVAGLWDLYVKGHTVEERLVGKGGHYFNTIRDRFEHQRSAVEGLVVPPEWSFKKYGTPEITPPFPMQKRTAWEVLTRNRVGNWSEPGTGKTNSALLAIRVAGAKNALVIAANNTVKGWVTAIENTFPDTEIHLKPTEPVAGAYNITILNYEKFQQANSEDLVWRLHKLAYDFVVLDEVQFVKQRQRQRHKDDRNKSQRRIWVEKLIWDLAQDNPDLYVLGMSATPVINNLFEARKLLEIVTGRSFVDMDEKATLMNAIAAHRNLMVYGFRYHANFDMKVHPMEIETVRNDLIEDLRGRNILETEQILLDAKLEKLYEEGHFKKGTLVYIEYVDGIDHRTRTFLEERNFRVGMCTGKDKSGLEPFREGKLDILIGSRTVATGVDGLQNVCDNVILLSPPWTGADEKQIEGRVVREGSDYDHVTMVWPQVVINLGEAGSWSWDKQRREIIEFKQTLSDCAVDGRPPKALLPSKHSLIKRAREALEDLIARLEADGYEQGERPVLEVPLPPKLKERAQVKHGDFREISRRWVTSNSETTHQRLKADKAEWFLYHTLYAEARTHWDEIPAEYIASQLKARPDLKIADFGCGTNLLKAALPEHDVVGLDHVVREGDDSTIECDIANTPLDTASKDAVVLSLALMGCNWPEYLTEAYRVLKPFDYLSVKPSGYLFVAESAKKWKDLAETIAEYGFTVTGSEQRGEFIYVRAVKAA